MNGPWRPAWSWLAVALGLVAGGGLAYWWMAPAPPAAADHGTTTQAAASSAAPPVPASHAGPAASSVAHAAPLRAAAPPSAASVPATATPRIARTRDPNGDLTPDITDYINEGEVPTMAQVIDRLHQAGIYSGLGAFQPPGTRPPLVGLAVPEDFVLPEGYVRHYQATDDGQRIEPILMYSPDHRFVDAAGRPIAVPKDRVVPPELAPPGMPIRRIVIPPPTEAGSRP